MNRTIILVILVAVMMAGTGRLMAETPKPADAAPEENPLTVLSRTPRQEIGEWDAATCVAKLPVFEKAFKASQLEHSAYWGKIANVRRRLLADPASLPAAQRATLEKINELTAEATRLRLQLSEQIDQSTAIKTLAAEQKVSADTWRRLLVLRDQIRLQMQALAQRNAKPAQQ
jgi:hypothetical protein